MAHAVGFVGDFLRFLSSAAGSPGRLLDILRTNTQRKETP